MSGESVTFAAARAGQAQRLGQAIRTICTATGRPVAMERLARDVPSSDVRWSSTESALLTRQNVR